MKKLILVLGLILLFSLTAFGQSPIKFYVGGSLGSSFVETKPTDIGGEDLKIDENGFAYKFYGGVNLIRFLSAEAGYRSLGTVKNSVSGVEFESKTSGFDLFAKGSYNLMMVEVFAKAGYLFWNTEVSAGSISADDDGSDFGWGLGAALNLGKIGIRAEWEKFNAGDLENLSMLSAGVLLYL